MLQVENQLNQKYPLVAVQIPVQQFNGMIAPSTYSCSIQYNGAFSIVVGEEIRAQLYKPGCTGFLTESLKTMEELSLSLEKHLVHTNVVAAVYIYIYVVV